MSNGTSGNNTQCAYNKGYRNVVKDIAQLEGLDYKYENRSELRMLCNRTTKALNLYLEPSFDDHFKNKKVFLNNYGISYNTVHGWDSGHVGNRRFPLNYGLVFAVLCSESYEEALCFLELSGWSLSVGFIKEQDAETERTTLAYKLLADVFYNKDYIIKQQNASEERRRARRAFLLNRIINNVEYESLEYKLRANEKT